MLVSYVYNLRLEYFNTKEWRLIFEISPPKKLKLFVHSSHKNLISNTSLVLRNYERLRK